jgi:hypothetical protein
MHLNAAATVYFSTPSAPHSLEPRPNGSCHGLAQRRAAAPESPMPRWIFQISPPRKFVSTLSIIIKLCNTWPGGMFRAAWWGTETQPRTYSCREQPRISRGSSAWVPRAAQIRASPFIIIRKGSTGHGSAALARLRLGIHAQCHIRPSQPWISGEILPLCVYNIYIHVIFMSAHMALAILLELAVTCTAPRSPRPRLLPRGCMATLKQDREMVDVRTRNIHMRMSFCTPTGNM